MSRILKRPMFRIGGSANDGVMSMAAPRRNYQEGSPREERVTRSAEEYARLLEKFAGPGPSTSSDLGDLLISGGLNLMSGRGAGKGTLGSIAESYREPYAAFSKARANEEALKRQLRMSAATQAISSDEARELQKLKNQAEMVGQTEKLKLAKEELFVKSPVGVALGSASKSVFNTLEDYNRNKIPYYEKPLTVNTNTKRVDTKQVEKIPVGVRFYDVNGDFYVRTEKGYKSIYAESGKEVAPIVPEKKPGFFDKTKEQGASYDPRSWNKQKFYESLAKKNPPTTME